MSKRAPDFSFERAGRPLWAWLWDLVTVDGSVRRAAGEALQAMMQGRPSIYTDWAELDRTPTQEFGMQIERFKQAVRATARAPSFSAPEFVRRLILYRIALKGDWHQRVARACNVEETPSRFEEALRRRIAAADGDAERVEATRRYLRWLCAFEARDCRREKAIFAGTESVTPAGLMAKVVFDALDDVLPADRPGLWVLLSHKDLFHDAAAALARIGPPAVDFAGFFLARLDAAEDTRRFDGAHALGSIGRDDPAVIDALLSRLRTGPEAVRYGAAECLGYAGPPLAGRLEVALDLLLAGTHSPTLLYAATPALASVGRDREEAMRRVLELAAPRPPRWRTEAYCPDYPYDEVMFERGTAIEALHNFQRFADWIVPALVNAIDTFEEYDPDSSYEGEHERVCRALTAFGPDAAPAVPRLVRYLGEWLIRPEEERQWPKDVFSLLASIGPPAAKALPTLERLRATLADENWEATTDLDPDDPLDQTILALRGS
jgi:hypothetical protein